MKESSTHPESLKTSFCGMRFDTPLVLLSGCVGFGEEYTRVEGFSNRDAGAVCLKGTTLKPRLGNKPHRVYETPSGMLNAIGLQNPGVDHVVKHILPTLDFAESFGFVPVGVYRHAGFKLGRWWDVGWWQKSLRAHTVPTDPPLSLAG